MRKSSLKIALMVFHTGRTLSSSCDTSNELSSGLFSGLVSTDNEGNTCINAVDLKSPANGTGVITDEQAEWLKKTTLMRFWLFFPGIPWKILHLQKRERVISICNR